MSTTKQETCASVTALTAVLTRIGDALANADLEALLAAEPLLEELTQAIAVATASPAERATLLPELRAAQIALVRAARLGNGLTLFRTASDHAQGVACAYARDGRATRRDPAATLNTRG
jgi:hypothetical protein